MNDAIHALAHVQKELKKLADENIAFLAASRADSFDEYKDRKSTRLNSSH